MVVIADQRSPNTLGLSGPYLHKAIQICSGTEPQKVMFLNCHGMAFTNP